MTVADVISVPGTLADDWRFTALVMRAWTEPEVADRYRVDPESTLAGLGLHLAPGEAAPAIAGTPGAGVRIEDLGLMAADAAVRPCCVD